MRNRSRGRVEAWAEGQEPTGRILKREIYALLGKQQVLPGCRRGGNVGRQQPVRPRSQVQGPARLETPYACGKYLVREPGDSTFICRPCRKVQLPMLNGRGTSDRAAGAAVEATEGRGLGKETPRFRTQGGEDTPSALQRVRQAVTKDADRGDSPVIFP